MTLAETHIDTLEGREVYQYTITNPGGTAIILLSYGAILSSVQIPDKNGRLGEITLGFNSLEGYLGDHPYFGATIGRFANRIAQGTFSLDETTYTLAVNNGENHLHGGVAGFDKQIWDAEPFENADEAGVRFRLTSPDGQEGYPGTLEVTATYTLNSKNELLLSYTAQTDKTTVVNLTNHTYWNLGGPGTSVLDHLFSSAAEGYLPVDETTIPLGRIAPVEDTPFDFRTPKTLGTDGDKLPGGYDHCMVLPENREGILRPLGRMIHPETGRRMEFFTDQPGYQLYTAYYLDGLALREGKRADSLGAFCVETQKFPDAPNRPAFPSTVLNPGETYRHNTKIVFSWE